MKKLSLLLVAALVALGASAGISNRVFDTKTTKSSTRGAKTAILDMHNSVADPNRDVKDVPTVISEIPGDCQVTAYTRHSISIVDSWNGYEFYFKEGVVLVAFAPNGDVYIKNPVSWFDDVNTWVKGTFDAETNIISIPTGQYLFWDNYFGYGAQLGWGYTYTYEDEDEEGTYYALDYEIEEQVEAIRFLLGEDGRIYLLDSEGDITAPFPSNYEAVGMFVYWSDDMSLASIEFADGDNPIFTYYDYVDGPAIPANPTADSWYDCGDEHGFSRFSFTLPEYDINGLRLHPEHLGFRVWINDGNGNVYPFVFKADTYIYDLEEDTDIIYQWIYDDGWDFSAECAYFYRTNAEGFEPLFVRNKDHNGNIGIQAVYTVWQAWLRDELPEQNFSDIVWLYNHSTDVNEMNADKTVANVRYFNITGQEMAQPQGMTIKVTTYTDGTTSAVKVVK